jgi:hypothetical protein
MTYDEDVAREHELDERARIAALELFQACRELGWGSGEPITDACSRIAWAAQQEGYVAPGRTKSTRRKMPHAKSRKVWDRDDWTCRRCGSHRGLTVDHITPVSKGGTDDLDNLQTLCGPCNSSKGARD